MIVLPLLHQLIGLLGIGRNLVEREWPPKVELGMEVFIFPKYLINIINYYSIFNCFSLFPLYLPSH